MKQFYATGLLLALSACAVGPDYHLPTLELPQSWHAPAPVVQQDAPVADDWWKNFHDATLDGLIERALANNQEIKVAEARVLEARGARRTAASALYPQLQASGQAVRENEGFETFNETLNLYQAEFDASYEIDLFGGNRRQLEAQKANLGASKADLRDVTISLTAELARDYLDWRQYQQQLQLTRDTVTAQEKLYAITQAQYQAGTISTFERSQAETLYKNTAARIPDLERRLAATGYAMSVLLGENPGALNDELKEPAALPELQPPAALDSPVSVIARRPDVARAERRLAAATALHGVAISNLYPKITLSALFGIQDNNLGPAGSVWSIGGNFAAPLLDFGKIEGQIQSADARQVEAFHTYRQVVLQALADVETSLATVASEQRKQESLASAAESAGHTVAMARIRYREGISDFTDVLQSEQQLYGLNSDLVASKAAQLKDMVALYKALGE